eukprot:570417-Rhodomonas_salina.3
MSDNQDKELTPDARFGRDLNERVHERILFHGVPSLDQALNISTNGFDEGSAKERCLFGPGFYHSDMLCKSLRYCDDFPSRLRRFLEGDTDYDSPPRATFIIS